MSVLERRLDGRDFFELCQQYRHATGTGAVEFEYIRRYLLTGKLPWPTYEDREGWQQLWTVPIAVPYRTWRRNLLRTERVHLLVVLKDLSGGLVGEYIGARYSDYLHPGALVNPYCICRAAAAEHH